MENRWSDAKASEFIGKYGQDIGDDLALRIYLAVLIGAEEKLVLHGGGNSSVKTSVTNILGESFPVIFVKASGHNRAEVQPEGYTGLDLIYLRKLRALRELSDEDMVHELQAHMLDRRAAPPPIETLVHAFIPKKYIDHTHADAILALTNQVEGDRIVRDALGDDVLILDYVTPGFKLARAAAAAYDAYPKARGMVWMHHGLVSWGDTAQESYTATVELITKAEKYLADHATRPWFVQFPTPIQEAETRLTKVAPIIRGLLAQPTGDADRPYFRTILQPLINREVLDFVDSDRGRGLALTSPLTSDHLIRTKALPLWMDDPSYDDLNRFREQVASAIQSYAAAYDAYVERHASRMPSGVARFDSLPRIILLPRLGVLSSGTNATAARIVRDIAAHTLAVKAQIGAMGTYRGIAESDLFDMEYRSLQHAQRGCDKELPLDREVALITGAAGAIGSGIAQELLENGCHVAVTDLPGENLTSLVDELRQIYGNRVTGAVLDVTNPDSVAEGFGSVIRTWGGVDLVIVNAGLAIVCSLADMDIEAFRRLERVNTEGTLLVLGEAARHFRLQGTGGDIILVSTKNVFSPGAHFGAYSATKAAAHQLGRIASLELAGIDVRVNMVAPDAVFHHGSRKSGLWAEVGPERMRSRGLDAKGLEEYYRSRNVLKARVTARHVAKGVLFFATRQTPTTGSTLPIDGGLPDATPR